MYLNITYLNFFFFCIVCSLFLLLVCRRPFRMSEIYALHFRDDCRAQQCLCYRCTIHIHCHQVRPATHSVWAEHQMCHRIRIQRRWVDRHSIAHCLAQASVARLASYRIWLVAASVPVSPVWRHQMSIHWQPTWVSTQIQPTQHTQIHCWRAARWISNWSHTMIWTWLLGDGMDQGQLHQAHRYHRLIGASIAIQVSTASTPHLCMCNDRTRDSAP